MCRKELFTGLLLLALSASAGAQSPLPAAFDKPVPEGIRDLQDIERHVQKLIAKVMPATVGLRIGQGQGSGVIIDRAGHILTAGHVSGAADQDATVILYEGSKLKGRTLGANNNIDSGMALITEKFDFPYLEMAKPGGVKKGQWVLALGHPGGWKPGRVPVARLGRVLEVNDQLIVTDCTLVGGDSGGPLFDMHGRVIGIHSRIGNKISANVHVPIDTYRDTWTRLVAREVWGSLPAQFDAIRPPDAYLGLKAGSEEKKLKILAITPNSPAANAGLKVDDTIVKVDNLKLSSVDDLGVFLRARRAGASITIHVLRGSQAVAVPVVLGKRPG